jgi:hypothetical protein
MMIRDKPTFSSGRILHKDYSSRDQLKKSLVMGLKWLDAKMN